MKFIETIQYVAIFSLIFSTFFLAIRTVSAYIKNINRNNTMTPQQSKEIDALIAATKGKFFCITFEKKDGTIRTVNGKDRYQRLIKGVGSPATNGLREAGYKSAVNRNKESWFSFQPEKVKTFKCGQIEKHFSV
jgi:hypothetical protein